MRRASSSPRPIRQYSNTGIGDSSLSSRGEEDGRVDQDSPAPDEGPGSHASPRGSMHHGRSREPMTLGASDSRRRGARSFRRRPELRKPAGERGSSGAHTSGSLCTIGEGEWISVGLSRSASNHRYGVARGRAASGGNCRRVRSRCSMISPSWATFQECASDVARVFSGLLSTGSAPAQKPSMERVRRSIPGEVPGASAANRTLRMGPQARRDRA